MKKNIVVLLGLGLHFLPFIAGDRTQKSLKPVMPVSSRDEALAGGVFAQAHADLPGAVPSYDRVPSDDHTWAPAALGVGAPQVGLFARECAFLGSSGGSDMFFNPLHQGAQAAPGAGVGGALFSLRRSSESSADHAQIDRAGNARLSRESSGVQGTFSQPSFGTHGSLHPEIQGDAQAAAAALGAPADRPVAQVAPRGSFDCCSIQ